MKNTLSVLLVMTIAATASAQTRADYDMTVKKYQQFYNNGQTDSVFNLLSERIQGMMPADKTKAMLSKLSDDYGKLRAYSFTKQDEHFTYYKTIFDKKTMTLAMLLSKDDKLENFRFIPYQPDTTVSNIHLTTKTGNIYGTLLLPDMAAKKVPVVLIIAGSGPTDRDGNNPIGVRANSYLMLANALQKEGIATVRYDKRGIAESAAGNEDEAAITFDNMVNDAAGFVTMLQQDSRFSEVIVLGHSEGSLIGMIAAHKAKANKYISVAGLGSRADKVIEKQLGVQSKKMQETAKVLLDSLAEGYTVQQIDPMLSRIFHPSVMPYLISWLKYDPQVEIRKLAMSTLIIQGTTDLQVSVDEAELLKKADPAALLKIIEGMNHVMKDAPADRQKNMTTYADPELPLSAALVPAIITFINVKK